MPVSSSIISFAINRSLGETLATQVNNEQQTVQSRGRTFHCRMRTNDGEFVLLNCS